MADEDASLRLPVKRKHDEMVYFKAAYPKLKNPFNDT